MFQTNFRAAWIVRHWRHSSNRSVTFLLGTTTGLRYVSHVATEGSALSSSSSLLQQVKLALCDAVPVEHFVPLSAVATRIREVDEDLFEALSSTTAGGLLEVVKQDSEAFETKRDAQQRVLVRRREVRIAPPAAPRSDTAKKPPQPEKETLPSHRSAVAMFWDQYDPKQGILRYIPTRFVSWGVVASVIPVDELKTLPKEYRSRNVVRVLRPYCDFALPAAGDVLLRVKPQLIGEAWCDAEAADLRLSTWLPNPQFVLGIANALPLSATPLQDVVVRGHVSAVNTYLEEIAVDTGRISLRSLVCVFPTLFCVYRRRDDVTVVASYIGRGEAEGGSDDGCGGRMMGDGQPSASGNTGEMHRIARLVADNMFPRKCATANDIATWLDDRGELEALERLGGLAKLLVTQKNVLVMGFDGNIQPVDDSMGENCAGSAKVPSYCGTLQDPPLADDAAVSRFTNVTSHRWSNRLRAEQQRKKRDLLYPNSVFRSNEVLSRYLHALCPTDRWISLSDLVPLLSEEARLWMPTTSLLGFMDKQPQLFDLIEMRQGTATSYGVRGRLPHEEVHKISASTWSDDELLRFILDTVSLHGSTISNLWAKLPLSVRKQFGKYFKLVEFMQARPHIFSFPSPSVVVVSSHPLDDHNNEVSPGCPGTPTAPDEQPARPTTSESPP